MVHSYAYNILFWFVFYMYSSAYNVCWSSTIYLLNHRSIESARSCPRFMSIIVGTYRALKPLSIQKNTQILDARYILRLLILILFQIIKKILLLTKYYTHKLLFIIFMIHENYYHY